MKGFDEILKQSQALGKIPISDRVTDSELASCMEEFGRKLVQNSRTFGGMDEAGKRALLRELQPYLDELRKMIFRRRNGMP